MNIIQLQEIWVSDTHSEPKDNKVYKTKGFKINFQKDAYCHAEEVWMIFKSDNSLTYINKYSDDLKCFNTKQEAIQHKNSREKHWLDWYKKQVMEYQEKIDNYKIKYNEN